MSRVPTLSNELSPRPRIRICEIPSNATAIDKQSTFRRLRPDSSQRFSKMTSIAQPRGRASSNAGHDLAKLQVPGRGTSFGSTQKFRDAYGSVPVQRLDRKVSDGKVKELVELRKQKLREAKRKGDEVEVFRLKNLDLFDEIERSQIYEDKPKDFGYGADFTRQPHHQGFTSQIDVFDFGFTRQSRSVNQGHTASLCWHLKLEYTQGLTVPEEFSQCTVHATPSPCASSSPSSTLQPASPRSLTSESRPSLRHKKVSSIGSSTLRDTSEPSSRATRSSTAIASEPSPPTKHSSIVPDPNEEDPFLYIAKYVTTCTQSDGQPKQAKQPRPHASSANAKRSLHTQCTCTNHNCRTYLSSSPSKHCRFCKLPGLQPEIAAAVERMEETRTSLLVQGDANLPAGSLSETDEFPKLEALQEDMGLVEMYNAETEKRCRNGVWWEGWLIVENLKRQGIVGSKPFVYAIDNSVA